MWWKLRIYFMIHRNHDAAVDGRFKYIYYNDNLSHIHINCIFQSFQLL